MKRLLVLSMMFLAYNADAQKISLAGGIGGAVNGSPSDNMVYKSDQSLLNYALQARLAYTTVTNWQYGVMSHLHELSGKSTKTYEGFHNRHLRIDSVGGDGKKLVYAKNTVNVSAFFNRNFNLNKKTSIYLGIAAGYVYARNNSLYYEENESYNGPDGGNGLCYGGQLGINSYLSEHVSIFLDVAVRYYNLEYDEWVEAPAVRPYETLSYSILAVPVTVGLNFDLFKIGENTRNSYNVRRKKYN